MDTARHNRDVMVSAGFTDLGAPRNRMPVADNAEKPRAQRAAPRAQRHARSPVWFGHWSCSRPSARGLSGRSPLMRKPRPYSN